MTTYTAEQKQQLVKAFTAAKKYLWDGKGSKFYPPQVDEFICIAMGIAKSKREITHYECCKAQQVIEDRIAPHSTVTAYLHSNNYITEDVATVETQAYRLAWLNALIVEFSA